MSALVFFILLLFVSFFAGVVGAISGLGGGVVLIPALILLFKVDIHYAMGASLISVMATSSGTALAYLRQGYTNIRVGILLESGAVVGAILGALSVAFFSISLISIILGCILIFSAIFSMFRPADRAIQGPSHPWAVALNLESSYPTPMGKRTYHIKRVPGGMAVISLAGFISGLLGIGAGALKVLGMDFVMGLPYKVSTTTSNFIIGITAAASAGIYFARGYIEPFLTFPVLIGVVLGAFVGAKILVAAKTSVLRIIFNWIILIAGIQTIIKGFGFSF